MRVDAIREDILRLFDKVSTTSFYHDGDIADVSSYNIDGRGYKEDSPEDLIAEYKEPEILITEEDVGRKVRLRNGDIDMITQFKHSEKEFKVGTPTVNYCVDGMRYIKAFNQRSPDDIVAFVE